MSSIMVDVEADGPIPGDYSMICFGAVVVEIKRTKDGGHMELQTVRYAAMVASMTLDQVIHTFGLIMGKMPESETLRRQAANNTKEQFASSPDLLSELDTALMDALGALTDMSPKALNSSEVK